MRRNELYSTQPSPPIPLGSWAWCALLGVKQLMGWDPHDDMYAVCLDGEAHRTAFHRGSAPSRVLWHPTAPSGPWLWAFAYRLATPAEIARAQLAKLTEGGL
jgi:hypothetical protein